LKALTPLALASLLLLAACGDDTANETQSTPETPPAATAPATTGENEVQREGREALDAIGEAGRATGEAAGAAARDLQERAGPAMERAREEGAQALDSAREGLNNLTRSAACQTARAADDADGIAANC
jgi:hypothetical protein